MSGAAIWCPSPNFGPRRDGAVPELVVIHYTAMADAKSARDRLCDPVFEVSAHYLIGRDGTLWQHVAQRSRAWHAGAGAWGGRGDVNSRSIGIELDNDGASPFAAPLMDRLERLLDDLALRWKIPPQSVIGHAEMAPGRKVDPGPRFDWRRLARSGQAVWPNADAPPADPAGLAASLDAIGYPEAPALHRLAAFRDRYRPGWQGPADAVDAGRAADLAHRFAIDRASGKP